MACGLSGYRVSDLPFSSFLGFLGVSQSFSLGVPDGSLRDLVSLRGPWREKGRRPALLERGGAWPSAVGVPPGFQP